MDNSLLDSLQSHFDKYPSFMLWLNEEDVNVEYTKNLSKDNILELLHFLRSDAIIDKLCENLTAEDAEFVLGSLEIIENLDQDLDDTGYYSEPLISPTKMSLGNN